MRTAPRTSPDFSGWPWAGRSRRALAHAAKSGLCLSRLTEAIHRHQRRDERPFLLMGLWRDRLPADSDLMGFVPAISTSCLALA